MRLSATDRAFVEKRERRSRYWPWMGGSSLAILAAYGAWLWVKTPQLINPWWVIDRIEAGTLSESTMGVMAALLPIVMAALLLFTFMVVLLWFIAFYHERRFIRLIRELEARSTTGRSVPVDRRNPDSEGYRGDKERSGG